MKRLVLVAPPADGPRTGGTLYDARLRDALGAFGVETAHVGVDAALAALRTGDARPYFVDSLHLASLPELARAAAGRPAPGLIAHYLPSLVLRGDVWEPADATPVERAALGAAGTVVAPSEWMAAALRRVGLGARRVVVVEPGVEVGQGAGAGSEGAFRAVLVGNLLPGKGIAPFLSALDAALGGATPALSLTIHGDASLDAEYAATCRAVARGSPALRDVVRLSTSPTRSEVLAAIAGAHVLVSASRMESYGMVLAEARAMGVPIVARSGGNVAFHVAPGSGGELAASDAALADALLRLARDRAEWSRRSERARRAIRRRTWKEAAQDLLSAMEGPS